MRANKVNGSFTAGSGQPEVTCLAPDSLLAEPVPVLELDLRWVQKEEVGKAEQGDFLNCRAASELQNFLNPDFQE